MQSSRGDRLPFHARLAMVGPSWSSTSGRSSEAAAALMLSLYWPSGIRVSSAVKPRSAPGPSLKAATASEMGPASVPSWANIVTVSTVISPSQTAGLIPRSPPQPVSTSAAAAMPTARVASVLGTGPWGSDIWRLSIVKLIEH